MVLDMLTEQSSVATQARYSLEYSLWGHLTQILRFKKAVLQEIIWQVNQRTYQRYLQRCIREDLERPIKRNDLD
jgi:hypothetical protein